MHMLLCLTQPPTTPTNFSIAQELQFQHVDCTSKLHTRYPSVRYASCFFSHPHWPYITATLLQVVAMSLLVAVNKSSVLSMKFTRH